MNKNFLMLIGIVALLTGCAGLKDDRKPIVVPSNVDYSNPAPIPNQPLVYEQVIKKPTIEQPKRDETITVSRSKAQACTPSLGCFPVLLGPTTPLGEWPLMHASVRDPGYGGDVLAFKKNDKSKREVWTSIHRVWLLNPKEQRAQRLKGPVSGRKSITNGCINVEDRVYDALVDCCSRGKVVVTE